MAYRWKPKLAEVDSDNPEAWGTCDKCGFITQLSKMVWQYDYRGSSIPQNTFILTCGRPTCLDLLNPQDAPFILPPDPLPIFNARPEPYVVDETNWLTTDDGSILATEDGDLFITSNPNPATNPGTSNLVANLRYVGPTLTVAYLDLFNGNPLASGVSILEAVTGSSERSDVFSALGFTTTLAQNVVPIIVATSSAATTNVTYVGIYDDPLAGTLLMSGPVSASPTVTLGNAVQFNSLGLAINLF